MLIGKEQIPVIPAAAPAAGVKTTADAASPQTRVNNTASFFMDSLPYRLMFARVGGQALAPWIVCAFLQGLQGVAPVSRVHEEGRSRRGVHNKPALVKLSHYPHPREVIGM